MRLRYVKYRGPLGKFACALIHSAQYNLQKVNFPKQKSLSYNYVFWGPLGCKMEFANFFLLLRGTNVIQENTVPAAAATNTVCMRDVLWSLSTLISMWNTNQNFPKTFSVYGLNRRWSSFLTLIDRVNHSVTPTLTYFISPRYAEIIMCLVRSCKNSLSFLSLLVRMITKFREIR